jgi:hypothetical protein
MKQQETKSGVFFFCFLFSINMIIVLSKGNEVGTNPKPSNSTQSRHGRMLDFADNSNIRKNKFC